MSEETRVSTYYGVFFLSIGATMPFVAIWLDSLGISTSMSGLILAAPPMAIVIFNIVIGSWADRLSDWRSAIIGCNVFVLLLSSSLLLWQSQWGILVLWTLSGLFLVSTAPITDAAALNMTARRGSDYAKLRALGSIGFIIGILAAGRLFESFGMRWFVGVLLFGAVARVAAAIALPNFRERFSLQENCQANLEIGVRVGSGDDGNTTDRDSTPALSKVKKPKLFSGLVSGLNLFRQPGIFSVIFGAALINASHSFNNIYSVLHWTQNDISTSMASSLWAIGVTAEVFLMWKFSQFSKHISARHCLLVAAAACTVRWFFTALNPSIAALFFLQALHSITFGLTFLASVNFIAKRVNPQHAAQAQSVLATLSTLLMAVGTWLSGQLYGSLGGYSYWIMAVMAIVGGLFILSSYRTHLEDRATPATAQ